MGTPTVAPPPAPFARVQAPTRHSTKGALVKQQYFKRSYSALEGYELLVDGLRTARFMMRARRSGLLHPDFIERVMLAVTEVNGCDVCSWVHTRVALDQGMNPEEIRALLGGDSSGVSAEEATGLVFAQHYADTKGRPSRAAWERLVTTYGDARALGLLGAARVMMIGNAFGMASSALWKRLRGRAVPGSRLSNELVMFVGQVLFVPFSAVHALLAGLLGRPLLQFGSSPRLWAR